MRSIFWAEREVSSSSSSTLSLSLFSGGWGWRVGGSVCWCVLCVGVFSLVEFFSLVFFAREGRNLERVHGGRSHVRIIFLLLLLLLLLQFVSIFFLPAF